MLDIHQLSCFVSVYESGSISQAAESIFLSQQAVSHSLRELEKNWAGRFLSAVPAAWRPPSWGRPCMTMPENWF